MVHRGVPGRGGNHLAVAFFGEPGGPGGDQRGDLVKLALVGGGPPGRLVLEV